MEPKPLDVVGRTLTCEYCDWMGEIEASDLKRKGLKSSEITPDVSLGKGGRYYTAIHYRCPNCQQGICELFYHPST